MRFRWDVTLHLSPQTLVGRTPQRQVIFPFPNQLGSCSEAQYFRVTQHFTRAEYPSGSCGITDIPPLPLHYHTATAISPSLLRHHYLWLPGMDSNHD